MILFSSRCILGYFLSFRKNEIRRFGIRRNGTEPQLYWEYYLWNRAV